MSTRRHGLFDYIFALALISPWLANFCRDKISFDVLALTGVFMLLLSQLTNYESGLIKLIPLKIHLALDVCVAVFLFSLPFCFSYSTYLPVFFSMILLIVVFFSETHYEETM